MPRIDAAHVLAAFDDPRVEGAAPTLSSLVQALEASLGRERLRPDDVRRTVREHPDLFYLLPAADAALAGAWSAEARAEYGAAWAACGFGPERVVRLAAAEHADVEVAAADPMPDPTTAVLALWRRAGSDDGAALIEALHEAVAIAGALRSAGPG